MRINVKTTNNVGVLTVVSKIITTSERILIFLFFKFFKSSWNFMLMTDSNQQTRLRNIFLVSRYFWKSGPGITMPP